MLTITSHFYLLFSRFYHLHFHFYFELLLCNCDIAVSEMSVRLSVCPSVCQSVKRMHCDKTKKNFCPNFCIIWKIDHPSFPTVRMSQPWLYRHSFIKSFSPSKASNNLMCWCPVNKLVSDSTLWCVAGWPSDEASICAENCVIRTIILCAVKLVLCMCAIYARRGWLALSFELRTMKCGNFRGMVREFDAGIWYSMSFLSLLNFRIKFPIILRKGDENEYCWEWD